jgi:hypothetical protein
VFNHRTVQCSHCSLRKRLKDPGTTWETLSVCWDANEHSCANGLQRAEGGLGNPQIGLHNCHFFPWINLISLSSTGCCFWPQVSTSARAVRLLPLLDGHSALLSEIAICFRWKIGSPSFPMDFWKRKCFLPTSAALLFLLSLFTEPNFLYTKWKLREKKSTKFFPMPRGRG